MGFFEIRIMAGLLHRTLVTMGDSSIGYDADREPLRETHTGKQRIFRRLCGVCALVVTPVLGIIGWSHSPGRHAVMALEYPIALLFSSGVSALIATVLYYRRSMPGIVAALPSLAVGLILLGYFLTLDYKDEYLVFETSSGMTGIIYEDRSGEFGSDFIFAVERKDGGKVGEAYLRFAMSADEVDYRMRERNGQIQVIDRKDSERVVAWYSPASDQVFVHRPISHF